MQKYNPDVFIGAAEQVAMRKEGERADAERCCCYAIISELDRNKLSIEYGRYFTFFDTVYKEREQWSESHWWCYSPFDYESRIFALLLAAEVAKDVNEGLYTL